MMVTRKNPEIIGNKINEQHHGHRDHFGQQIMPSKDTGNKQHHQTFQKLARKSNN